MSERDARFRIRPAAEDEAWKADAACGQAVRDYAAMGWGFQRAQRHVTDLYYVPGGGVKPGRPPTGGRVEEDDLFFLPRRWCASCPVAERCLEEALADGDVHGFRAGFTPNQLGAMVKARRRARRIG